MQFEMQMTYTYDVPDADLTAIYGTSDPAICAGMAAGDPASVLAFFPGEMSVTSVVPITMPKVLERNG
jgi:hypothetical protein